VLQIPLHLTVKVIAITVKRVNRKVTQPILKYLLTVEIQHNFIALINAQWRRDCTRAQAGHVML
jgi:hypothetical protein